MQAKTVTSEKINILQAINSSSESIRTDKNNFIEQRTPTISIHNMLHKENLNVTMVSIWSNRYP